MAELLKNKQDQAFYEVFYKLPLFPFYSLLKADTQTLQQQKEAFFATGTNPVFSYTKAEAFDVELYLDNLKTCTSELQDIQGPDWIRELYLAKVKELKTRAQLIQAIQKKNDKRVVELAKKLFSTPQCSQSNLKNELKQMVANATEFHIHKKPIDAQKFSRMVQKTLDHYGMTNWKIKFHNGSSVRLTRGRTGQHVTVRIPKTFKASTARAKRVLIHEIEVHALRTQNGINSPLHILRIGLDHYLETDEGLAIYFQLQRGKSDNQFDPSFWESYACALSETMDFKSVFNALLAARQKLDKATGHERPIENQMNRIWNVCVRTYRGITHPNQPKLGTCKDHVYRSGLAKIRNLEIEDPELQKQLFAGNLGLHHLDTIKELDLSYVKISDLINK